MIGSVHKSVLKQAGVTPGTKTPKNNLQIMNSLLIQTVISNFTGLQDLLKQLLLFCRCGHENQTQKHKLFCGKCSVPDGTADGSVALQLALCDSLHEDASQLGEG